MDFTTKLFYTRQKEMKKNSNFNKSRIVESQYLNEIQIWHTKESKGNEKNKLENKSS